MMIGNVPKISLENAIAIFQTVVTVLALKKVAKGHLWLALGGLAALELPVRVIDDNHDVFGRESFLGLTSLSYVLFVSLIRLTVAGTKSLSGLFARQQATLRSESTTPLKLESTSDAYTASPEMIIAFIEEQRPTFDELVAEFSESRDALFAVLESRASPYGDSIVIGPAN